MSGYYKLPEVKDAGVPASISALCRSMLEKDLLDAVMIPQHLPRSAMVQHALVRDPEAVKGVDPIAPVMPVNGAVLAARLTRQDPGGKVGVLLRPCEMRAFFELVKLHQGDRDRLMLIGIDCLGTFEPPAFREWSRQNEDGSKAFLEAGLKGSTLPEAWPTLRRCCQACEYPTPTGADVQMLLVGTDGSPLLRGATEKGETLLQELELSKANTPGQRDSAVDKWVQGRTESRDRLFEEVEAELLPLDKLLEELSSCINCYNCRDACPVCYCKGCVFDGQTFEHPASQYLSWAKRKGVVKMPTDTLFFHLTRMAHMSTSCVGCGQCSSACPMGIRVAEIFRTVSRKTQGAFDYVSGRDVAEPLPLATFREEELQPR
jgi:formate dehydrogenase subunit beta